MRVRLDTSRHPYSVSVGHEIKCFSNREAALDHALSSLDKPASITVTTPSETLHRRELLELELRQIKSGVE